ncbi:hypothetical protein IFM89_010126 [Coptis chinensis]|uniref:F-box domain-containing protein n=1 Tax=Coptis chinensis TaxID=261450 RepID=A0A835IBC5_9MAGN|nr:hypothetical protein IFM89_010126 [Coptis chinensis]
MNKLPRDIVHDIFSRLPIRCLCLSRCVCKNWYNTISSPSFTTLQIKIASNENNHHFLLNHKNSLVGRSDSHQLYFVENDEDLDANGLRKPIKVDIPFFNASNMSDLIVMGSCNGLLCVSNVDWRCGVQSGRRYKNLSTLPSNPIYIFNPVTLEQLPLPMFIYPECMKIEEFSFGFGFDVVKQQYKAVLVMFYKYDVMSDYVENEVQVCTMGNTTWSREIGGVLDILINAYLSLSYVFVDGSLHWIVMKDPDSPTCRSVIVSFQLGVEEFTTISTPKSIVMNQEGREWSEILGQAICYTEEFGVKSRSLDVDEIHAPGCNSIEVVPIVASFISIKSACGMARHTEKLPLRQVEVKDHHRKFGCCLQ